MVMRYPASVVACSGALWRRETGTSEQRASSRSRFTRQSGCISDTAIEDTVLIGYCDKYHI